MLASRRMRTTIESNSWTTFLFRFDEDEAKQNLSWAMEYWLSKREPLPEKRSWRKCFACPLNAVSLCKHALHDPDPSFKVEHRPNARIVVSRHLHE